MSRGRSVLGVGLVAVAVWAWALTSVMESGPEDLWSAMVIGPLLVLVSVPMIARAARVDGWAAAVPLLWVALVLKLVSSYVRYVVAFDVYSGGTDALRYHRSGREIAAGLWRGDVRFPVPPIGTEALEVATGLVYAVIGPTLLGGFLVFGWLALWGQWCCYRAFRIALPDGSARGYGVAVLLWPSLLYWPSSVGKEALMILAIGLVSLGVARLTTGASGGPAPLVLGLVVAGLIRPHVALLLTGALFVAWLLRRPARRTVTAPIVHVGGVLLGALLVAGLVVGAAQFLGIEKVTAASVQTTLESTAARTAKGGSEFTPQPVTSIGDLPGAGLSVLFRPWPWEAHNVLAMSAGVESLLLLLLLGLAWRRLLGLPRLVLREPYVAYTVVFVLLFVYAFSSFGNFGLLTRERAQVLPFLLVLPFLPLRRPHPSPAKPATTTAHQRLPIGARP
jgi:hypothetical protein